MQEEDHRKVEIKMDLQNELFRDLCLYKVEGQCEPVDFF